jgi:hypothetical protein
LLRRSYAADECKRFVIRIPPRAAAGTQAHVAKLTEQLNLRRQGVIQMNRRDQELLDKQLHAIYVPRRNDFVLMLAVLAVFFAGIAFGGFLFAYTSEPSPSPMQVAAIAPPITQQ